jgi:hypothetical protein
MALHLLSLNRNLLQISALTYKLYVRSEASVPMWRGPIEAGGDNACCCHASQMLWSFSFDGWCTFGKSVHQLGQQCVSRGNSVHQPAASSVADSQHVADIYA